MRVFLLCFCYLALFFPVDTYFLPDNLNMDIAVITVAMPLTLDPWVVPICLPTPAATTKIFQNYRRIEDEPSLHQTWLDHIQAVTDDNENELDSSFGSAEGLNMEETQGSDMKVHVEEEVGGEDESSEAAQQAPDLIEEVEEELEALLDDAPISRSERASVLQKGETTVMEAVGFGVVQPGTYDFLSPIE
jgi:hypothetical protein